MKNSSSSALLQGGGHSVEKNIYENPIRRFRR
jgi:hypothetical protein